MNEATSTQSKRADENAKHVLPAVAVVGPVILAIWVWNQPRNTLLLVASIQSTNFKSHDLQYGLRQSSLILHSCPVVLLAPELQKQTTNVCVSHGQKATVDAIHSVPSVCHKN